MTSDAKIGLLLGLVFIFIIAFVINGLPGLHQKDNSNKLTTNMVGLESNPSGIGANERRVQMALDQPAAGVAGGVQQVEVAPSATVTPLPQGAPVAAGSAQFGHSSAQPAPSNVGVAPAEMTPAVSIDPTVSAPAQNTPAVNTQPTAAPEPAKVYVVQSGDSISGIAKKVYGVKEGVKQKNIDAIFAANRKTLNKINDLQVGQKLVIPSIPGSTAASSTPAEVLTDKNFTKVESVGQKHSTANTNKPAATAKSGSVYVVKEGDSLWKIAASQLGDGNRYKDIVKLNSDILSSEDDIAVGMQLKMPTK
ncbi:MAG: LysM peptidoglycan-binding domain-containing protein [Sedimentisphaerales bacterium]|jgi:nucleoid-associated protein YgaU